MSSNKDARTSRESPKTRIFTSSSIRASCDLADHGIGQAPVCQSRPWGSSGVLVLAGSDVGRQVNSIIAVTFAEKRIRIPYGEAFQDQYGLEHLNDHYVQLAQQAGYRSRQPTNCWRSMKRTNYCDPAWLSLIWGRQFGQLEPLRLPKPEAWCGVGPGHSRNGAAVRRNVSTRRLPVTNRCCISSSRCWLKDRLIL